MSINIDNPIWVVVEVWRGIPLSVSVFRDEQLAADHQKKLRNKMNPDEDEAGIFYIDAVGPYDKDTL